MLKARLDLLPINFNCDGIKSYYEALKGDLKQVVKEITDDINWDIWTIQDGINIYVLKKHYSVYKELNYENYARLILYSTNELIRELAKERPEYVVII